MEYDPTTFAGLLDISTWPPTDEDYEMLRARGWRTPIGLRATVGPGVPTGPVELLGSHLDYDLFWVTAEGQAVPIMALTTSHLRNIISFLEARARSLYARHLESCFEGMLGLDPDEYPREWDDMIETSFALRYACTPQLAIEARRYLDETPMMIRLRAELASRPPEPDLDQPGSTMLDDLDVVG